MCKAATGSKLRHTMSLHIITYYMYYVLLHNAGYMMQMIVSSILGMIHTLLKCLYINDMK